MFREERQAEIMAVLNKEVYASVEYLSSKLHASQSSIRRDVAVLAQKGLLKRSYGGVELLSAGAGAPIPFSVHNSKDVVKKREMARIAAGLVEDNSVIFLDGSSACYYLAEQLAMKSNLTVITNNVDSVNILSQSKSLRVYSTGGLASNINRSVLTGSLAYNAVSGIHASIFFFSTLALSKDGMISDDSEEENTLRRIMFKNSDKRVLLCTDNRLNTKSTFIFGNAEELDAVISNTSLEGYFECDTSKLKLISPEHNE